MRVRKSADGRLRAQMLALLGLTEDQVTALAAFRPDELTAALAMVRQRNDDDARQTELFHAQRTFNARLMDIVGEQNDLGRRLENRITQVEMSLEAPRTLPVLPVGKDKPPPPMKRALAHKPRPSVPDGEYYSDEELERTTRGGADKRETKLTRGMHHRGGV